MNGEQRINCRHAALEVVINLGIFSLGPRTGELVRDLRACPPCECGGLSREDLLVAVDQAMAADQVLALFN